VAADFDLKKDSKGEWYWTLQAENNKTIAKSSESYKNRSDCLHSVKIVKELSPKCTVWDMTTDPITKIEHLP
jgi:uncharacterized protein YegP (UPF0339 family)